jgi:uncharacterized protein YbcI
VVGQAGCLRQQRSLKLCVLRADRSGNVSNDQQARRRANAHRRLRIAPGRRMMTRSDAERPADRGVKLAAISTLAVRLFSHYTGRGPTGARTVIDGDMVIVALHDTLTNTELTLVDNGQAEIVLATRKILQGIMRTELIDGVQQILQNTVTAFLSCNDADPDIAVLIFMLAASEQ